jgi:hypothetical protein
MGKSFCFFFQKEVLSCFHCVSPKATRYDYLPIAYNVALLIEYTVPFGPTTLGV